MAARGFDIADLPAVFDFDVPFNAEDYIHRIGRTGRAGASGLAVTLVTRDDTRLVSDIEKLIKKKIELEPFELEDERPRRPPRRVADDEPRFDSASPAARVPPAPRAPAPSKSRDPFFDRPYGARFRRPGRGAGCVGNRACARPRGPRRVVGEHPREAQGGGAPGRRHEGLIRRAAAAHHARSTVARWRMRAGPFS